MKRKRLKLILDENLRQLVDVEKIHDSNRMLGNSSDFKELVAAFLMVKGNLKK